MDNDQPVLSQPGEPGSQTDPGSWVGAALRDMVGTIVPAIVIALLIHLFLAQATRVYGQSMEPNLHTNERLVIEKISYHLHGPRRATWWCCAIRPAARAADSGSSDCPANG